MDHWYRRDSFTIGDSYFDADGLNELEYLGIVSARMARHLIGDRSDELDTASDSEPVMLFRIVGDDVPASADSQVVYYTHSQSDADRGYHFIKIADAVTDAPAPADRYAE